ncbi:MAG TPA: hypothetical protein VGK73_04315, partial [Polyangiaceae bacterium]
MKPEQDSPPEGDPKAPDSSPESDAKAAASAPKSDAEPADSRPEKAAGARRTKRASRRTKSRRKQPQRKPWQSYLRPTLLFVLATLLLSAMVNVRYPSDEPRLWYFIPSSDIAIIFVFFAMMGLLREKVPKWAFGVIVGWLFLVRVLRLGDGIQQRYFEQQFTLYTDLPLVPEAVRFVWSTRSFWQFSLGLIGALAGLAALGYGSYKALRLADQYLRETEHLYIGGALIGLAYLANTARPPARGYEELYSGGFAASAFP